MDIQGPCTCAVPMLRVFKDEILDERDLVRLKGVVAINAAIDHLLEIAAEVGMRTTRRVLCPQDQAFLHANVAIPAGVMRDEPIQRGDFLVVLHAVALWPPKLFYAICPSIVCHDLLL